MDILIAEKDKLLDIVKKKYLSTIRTLRTYNIVPVPTTNRQFMIYQLVEPAIKAFDKLNQFEVHGTVMSPDTYYQLVLDITNDEKMARRAQAELMLMQMPD